MGFPLLIKEARIAKGLLVREVAHKVGIDASLLSRIENGDRLATEDLIGPLADVLALDAGLVQKEWLASKLMKQLAPYPDMAKDVMNMVMERVEVYSASSSEMPVSLSELLSQLSTLRETASTFQPLDETKLSKLQEYFFTRYTYHSNRIEGNTLSMQETALVIGKGITIAGKSVREHLEAINHQEAVEYLESQVQKGARLTESFIKELHYLVLKGIDKRHAGVYRSSEVRISGSAHIPPAHYQVPDEMKKLIQYYQANRLKIHPVVMAADLHLMLVGIHPFMDGNGRTSRLLMNLVLMQGGYFVTAIKGDLTERLEYYDALEKAHVLGQTLPFRLLVAKTVKESLTEYISMLQ
jgi:Fic family protein